MSGPNYFKPSRRATTQDLWRVCVFSCSLRASGDRLFGIGVEFMAARQPLAGLKRYDLGADCTGQVAQK